MTLGKDEQVVWRATEVLMDKVLSLVSFKDVFTRPNAVCSHTAVLAQVLIVLDQLRYV